MKVNYKAGLLLEVAFKLETDFWSSLSLRDRKKLCQPRTWTWRAGGEMRRNKAKRILSLGTHTEHLICISGWVTISSWWPKGHQLSDPGKTLHLIWVSVSSSVGWQDGTKTIWFLRKLPVLKFLLLICMGSITLGTVFWLGMEPIDLQALLLEEGS